MRYKFLLLNQQTTCVDVSFPTRCPYAIVLSTDRWIKEEIFLISKEYSFQTPDFETTQKFFATVEAFLLSCIGNHLCWNASIGRQMQVNFCYSSNRPSADCYTSNTSYETELVFNAMELESLLIAVGFDEHFYLKWVNLLLVEYKIWTFLFGKP